MNQTPRFNATTVGLYLVGFLLAANLVVTLSRGDGPTLIAPAMAQRQAPIAGGAGIFVMPAQLSVNTWGCYLMDVDRGSLCVYQFQPGAIQLKFLAARNFTNDIKLGNFNTAPTPQEVADLVTKQNQAVRATAAPEPGDDRVRKDNP